MIYQASKVDEDAIGKKNWESEAMFDVLKKIPPIISTTFGALIICVCVSRNESETLLSSMEKIIT